MPGIQAGYAGFADFFPFFLHPAFPPHRSLLAANAERFTGTHLERSTIVADAFRETGVAYACMLYLLFVFARAFLKKKVYSGEKMLFS